mmetsp:Transcript_43685/g.76979  ORF Transcript_43685/g.76979 Transcript_43685/m.76979 type:complete len:111 (+) Transcript_43685:197-529(+)
MHHAYHAGPLTFDPPALPSAWYGGSHFLQYFLRLQFDALKPEGMQRPQLYSAIAQWYCRRWPDLHLEQVCLYFVRKWIPAPGAPLSERELLSVWRELCPTRSTSPANYVV